MSMTGWMILAVIGALVSLVSGDLAAACDQAWGTGHMVSRHARLLARAMTALWLAAVMGGVHALSGY